MHDLEYLTEKDLEYFKKKQDDGDPVRIIYLSPEVLDSLSFEDIDSEVASSYKENVFGVNATVTLF